MIETCLVCLHQNMKFDEGYETNTKYFFKHKEFESTVCFKRTAFEEKIQITL